ncbi:MAG: symmetrical bis(5'-nucleosyl)-tetraphosphatase [Gammaproteobacteria bacterium]|nr:symmetrical bis(5'-nucleosyl)-tetraphosphatase [Gammaproteobacteria bacterium]
MTHYAIGDIQGCYGAFEALLERLSFDAARDRLWLVGDLVNRGPDSLRVLRRVAGLGEAVTTVLGNHDLHLLAAAAGGRRVGAKDTFTDVLRAGDSDALLDWLRRRPLLHVDREARRVLVHAGIPPAWSIIDASERAAEAEALLRGPEWRETLAEMYGNEPSAWQPDMSRAARLRYTINALTRMRFVKPDGGLDFECTGPPGSQPKGLTPWFDVPGRRAEDWHVVFGHWSALGVLRRPGLTALDSGCVWGRELTAVALDDAREPVAIACETAAPRR